MSLKFCNIYDIEDYGDEFKNIIISHLPDGTFKKILIKPNWVIHETNPNYPISVLVTSSKLIDLVIESCIIKYKTVSQIIIADVPLQSSDWSLMTKQSGIDSLIEKYKASMSPKISFVDLRREIVRFKDSSMVHLKEGDFGDPQGYREVVIDEQSFLDSISNNESEFRVADYNPSETQSNHRKGFHRYLIAGSILDAELIINMPKMKSHQKSGITGALKNLVGINGNKANLVHFRHGKYGAGGDEYPSDISFLIVWQTRIKEYLRNQSKTTSMILYKPMQMMWRLFRRILGIEVKSTNINNAQKKFYLTGGAWFGNDTIWRMIYDLNKIILYAAKDGGKLKKDKQREYIAILDGVIAGEGNGPLEPLPLKTDLVMFSNDPFLMDMVMAQLMSFDYNKIPMLKNYNIFNDKNWGNYDGSTVEIYLNDSRYCGIQTIPIRRKFIAPPGWRGNLEIT